MVKINFGEELDKLKKIVDKSTKKSTISTKSEDEEISKDIKSYTLDISDRLNIILSSLFFEIQKLDVSINKLHTEPSVDPEDIIKKQYKNILIQYPSIGLADISSGNTIISFNEGTVTYPDGTSYKMTSSLKEIKIDYIRSFTLYTEKPINISIIGKGTLTSTVLPGIFRQNNTEVNIIRINSSSDNKIWISGSILVDGSPEINNKEMPSTIIAGSKTDISTTSSQITTTSTPITKVVTIKCRSLGTGTYIALGNEDSQEFRLTAVGDSYDIDFIDSMDKIYAITDVGNSSVVEFIGA